MIGMGHYIAGRGMIGSPGSWNGAALDVDFRGNIAFVSGSPRVIAGTTRPEGYPGVGTFTRNSAADWLNVAGDGLEAQAAANALRRDPVRGALIEPAVTYLGANSELSGAAAGTPGTAPTGWLIAAAPAGLSREVVAVGTVNNMPFIDIRYFGTPNSLTGQTPCNGVAHVLNIGDTVFHSIFVALVAGSLTNVTGFALRAAAEVGTTTFTPTSTLQRVTNVRTLTTTAARWVIRYNHIDTVTACDFTLRLAMPTTVNLSGAVATYDTSPALTGASSATRLADVLSLPVSLSGDFTAVAIGRAPAIATPSSRLLALNLNATNHLQIRRGFGDPSQLLFESVIAGSGTGNAATATGFLVGGSRFAIATRRSGSTVAISGNGASVVSATPSSMPASASGVDIGHVAGTFQWNDFIERVIVFPTAVNDATLQQYSTLATWGG